MNEKFFTPEKILLILHPDKFTEFNYYKYELSYLEKKNYKIIIHDLSNISHSTQYNKLCKTKRENRAIKFSSLILWINEFNKIRKRKNILIYDFLDYGDMNFKILVIKLFLKFSKLPILKYGVKECSAWKPKKNLRFFLRKIFEHKLNLKLYFFAIREKFFLILTKFIKFNKIFLLTNKDFNAFEHKENICLVKSHSSDYSNSLLERRNNPSKKRYIVYVDSGVPYFPGDAIASGSKLLNVNPENWYKELNLFFDKLEKFFKAKIIIVPHSKYKMTGLKNKNLNPHFNNRLSDNSYNAVAKLIPKSLFVVSPGSTALSYAIIHYKPVQFTYSKNYSFAWNMKEDLFVQANLAGMKPINIASIEKKNLIKNLKVNKAKYDSYKFKYLTYKNVNSETPNHKIIQELMDQSI